MGRGLSDLQRDILRLAYRNRLADCGGESGQFHVLVRGPLGETYADDAWWRRFGPQVFAGDDHLPHDYDRLRLRCAGLRADYSEARQIADQLQEQHRAIAVTILPEAMLAAPYLWWRYADLYYTEMYWHLYGWAPRTRPRPCQATPEIARLTPEVAHFDRQGIGEQAYAVATTVVSRACRRLADRGLVGLPHWREHVAGVLLTAKGIEAAKALSVAPCILSTAQPIADEAAPHVLVETARAGVDIQPIAAEARP
jgi:hypothetical protein